MDDDLIIDAGGSPSAASTEAKTRLAHSSGTWKLLSTPSELLVGLRERPQHGWCLQYRDRHGDAHAVAERETVVS